MTLRYERADFRRESLRAAAQFRPRPRSRSRLKRRIRAALLVAFVAATPAPFVLPHAWLPIGLFLLVDSVVFVLLDERKKLPRRNR